MKIGVIREIKDKEARVSLTPHGVEQLSRAGHDIFLEQNAGLGSGFSNQHYQSAGADIVSTEVAWNADLVIKVKEPLPSEYQYLKNNILFTYLHLAGAAASLTAALIEADTTAIAYETIEGKQGGLPLLAPMSAVAGNMASLVGAYYLAMFNGGKGVQLGSVLGERNGKVMVIGCGVVGEHAAKTAAGMGANVYLFGLDKSRFESIESGLSNPAIFVQSNAQNISRHIRDCDLLIGAALRVGAKAAHIVSEAMVKTMQPGSVLVDVSIDQGGCIETSRPTSHSDPVYVKHGVTHYCVTNMPGAYPRTATLALTNATLPYILSLANKGLSALNESDGFARGVNIHRGWITCQPVAEGLQQESLYKSYADIESDSN